MLIEFIKIVDVGDSGVEGGELIWGDFVFVELFEEPGGDELLWLFECDLIGVVNGDIEVGDTVGDDGDTGAHLAGADDAEGLDVMGEELA